MELQQMDMFGLLLTMKNKTSSLLNGGKIR